LIKLGFNKDLINQLLRCSLSRNRLLYRWLLFIYFFSFSNSWCFKG